MLTKLLASAISKAQIIAFLGLPRKVKASKNQLIARLLLLIEADACEKTRLLEYFPKELAVGPTELEELLQCSPSERKRWVKEGRIPVLEYRSFKKAGRELQYAVHERKLILDLSDDEVARWREEYHAQVQANRRAGAQVAAQRRKANRQMRQDFLLAWQRTVENWQQESPEVAAVLQLSYWTLWASRWAKENHVRSLRGTKYAAQYAKRRDEWYQRKNETMRVLAQTPQARLTFYRPLNADKHRLWLCEEHYAMKMDECYEDIWEFYYANAAMIERCPHCSVKHEKDFYALYYLEVSAAAFPDLRFSFHVPYPIGKVWFPPPQKLLQVVHMEQEGIFRFGRALLAHEKITHREQDVRVYLEQALLATKKCYYLDTEYAGETTAE